MVVRRCRKRKKYLGNRTRGAGDTKNRRGAGSKGGKGNVGRWKHKKASFQHLVGTKVTQKAKSTYSVITLFDINNYVDKLLSTGKMKADNVVLDFKEDKFLKKYDKVLGKGNINYKVVFKNVKVSKGVEEKIKGKGGSIE